MEILTLILNGAAVVAAVLAALFAWKQANEAKKSRLQAEKSAGLAEESTRAAARSAAAAEELVNIERERDRPEPWSADHVRGDTYRITNTSGEVLIVQSTVVDPPEGASAVTFTTPTEGELDVGDCIEFVRSRGFGRQARKITVTWRYTTDADDDYRRGVFGI